MKPLGAWVGALAGEGPVAGRDLVGIFCITGLLGPLQLHPAEPSGKERAMPAVARAFDTGSPIAMSPRVADGMIYVGGEEISALDAATGHLRWRYRSGPGYTGPPW